MATSDAYLTFVLEQLPPLWSVRTRKMFGEYRGIYGVFERKAGNFFVR